MGRLGNWVRRFAPTAIRHACDGELLALSDGQLSEQEAERWSRHLAACPECRHRQEVLSGAAALVADLAAPGLPKETLLAIREMVRQAAAAPRAAERPEAARKLITRCLGSAIASTSARSTFPLVCEMLLGKRTAPALIRLASSAYGLDAGTSNLGAPERG